MMSSDGEGTLAMRVETINCSTDSIDPDTLVERLFDALDKTVVEALEESGHSYDVSGYVDSYRVVLTGGEFKSLTIEQRRNTPQSGVRDVSAKFVA